MNLLRINVGTIALLWAVVTSAATLPADWEHEQRFEVATPGLVKLNLPVETLDASRPGLEDLRLFDGAGNEVPYLVERPRPVGNVSQSPQSFQVALNADTTAITLETGLKQPVEGVTLETPANAFIKSVQVEGSADGTAWQLLAQGQPIFRQSNGASQLRVAVPPGVRRWLRLTVDDKRSQPIPFTGARVHAAAGEPIPSESMTLAVSRRDESPGETRLTLNLGAANLDLAAIQVETPEPLFTRQVTVSVPQVAEVAIREQNVAQAVIYRVAVDGQPASANLKISVESQIRARELVLRLKNQDSPPLPLTAVRAERRPVYLVFLARSAGIHHLLTGNRRCAAPRYDVAALGANLKGLAASPLALSPLTDSPAFRAPEVLAGVQEGGTVLDVAAWRYRKPVKMNRPGAQQIELDPEVLAHSESDLGDLRLLRGGKQIQYILERTSISRPFTPMVTAGTDPQDAKVSRWLIKLPQSALPLTRLSCVARTPLFRREVALYEEVSDERGEKYHRPLGAAAWVQTPERVAREFVLGLDGAPRSDTLVLETHNGDNPAIELDAFQVFYPATRLLFKAQPNEELSLYYGNPQAAAPRYDLSLVAGQLVAAEKCEATLGPEVQLKRSRWNERPAGQGGVVLWGALALVVAALLVVISRLLPKVEK